jgi:lysozyme
MPPVVDLEWDIAVKNGPDRWAGTDPDDIINKTLSWMNYVESKTHRKPVLYTARAWWDERIHDEGKFAKFANYKIWIADYSKSSRGIEVPKVPNKEKAALWQFTESARLSTGFGGGLDANIYKDSEEHFYEDFQTQKFN